MARDPQEQIKKLIIGRRLLSGAVLPTEPELMALLGASRNSVREALKALRAMGIVEIRHSFGTYVGPMSLAPVTRRPPAGSTGETSTRCGPGIPFERRRHKRAHPHHPYRLASTAPEDSDKHPNERV